MRWRRLGRSLIKGQGAGCLRWDPFRSPAYDMITTVAYPRYQQNPPGISFMGEKTWSPGKSLGKFIAATFGVSVKAGFSDPPPKI
jgi:hypothetical protein